MSVVLKCSTQAEGCDAQAAHVERVPMILKTVTQCPSRQGSQCGRVVSAASPAKMEAETEKAAFKAKAAALKEKLPNGRGEFEWQAKQMRREAAVKAGKQVHQSQTAITEADAKIEVLQKYTNIQTHRSAVEVGDVRTSPPVSGSLT